MPERVSKAKGAINMSMRLKKAMIEYAKKNWKVFLTECETAETIADLDHEDTINGYIENLVEDITESGDPEAVALYAEIIEAIA